MKIKVFLGDLVHTWEKNSVWTMPLNIGLIGAYLLKHLENEIEVTLFKRPEKIIDEIKKTKPEIVALGYYVWNINLNNRILEIAKNTTNSKTLTIGGGPIFSDVNANEGKAREFFSRSKYCDVYVLNQGESGILEAVKKYLESGNDISTLKKRHIKGCLVNNLPDNVLVDSPLPQLNNLDDIPSPYLTGLLDSFLNENFIPIIETNRSCPYRCTYCSWGIASSKLNKYSLDRVLSEIEYVSKNSTKCQNLIIADANFGIFERDLEIAKKIYYCHKHFKFPIYVTVYWNKSNPERAFRVVSQMKEICNFTQSFQSLNQATLKAIKRKNISLENVTKIVKKISNLSKGKYLYTELILGLPYETVDSHAEAIKKLIDAGVSITNYNLHILPGTEMDTDEYRKRYGYKTVYRLHDNAFGIYDGVKVLEAQEVAAETSTIRENELKSFRFIHFLLQFMWEKKWYRNYLTFLKENLGIHPVAFIIEIAQRCKQEKGNIAKLYTRFIDDHNLECFDTAESLIGYWSQEEPFERLRSGEYGKLNFLYAYVILLEYYDNFNQFLLELTGDFIKKIAHQDSGSYLDKCKEILNFNKELMVVVNSDGSFIYSKQKRFEYNILSWKEKNYHGDLTKNSIGNGSGYTFFLEKDHKNQIKKMLEQYKTKNLNMTLRKMAEYNRVDFLTYSVK